MPQWSKLLAPDVPWQAAYEAVAEHVKGMFDAGDPMAYSTSELVEHIWPKIFSRGPEQLVARKRMFQALAALSKYQLKRYCEHGPVREMKNHKGKLIVPLIWRAPKQDGLRDRLRVALEPLRSGTATPEAIAALDVLLEEVSND